MELIQLTSVLTVSNEVTCFEMQDLNTVDTDQYKFKSF